jgi:CRP/FNR family cyclic AMP-dependent transcriptional regulator
MSIECFTSETRSILPCAADPNGRDHADYGLPLADLGPAHKPKIDSFFSNLSDTSIRAMDEIRHIVSYSNDTIIFLEGDAAHGVYLLYEGCANVFTANLDGKTLVLKTALPGDVLGLNSVLTGTPHDVTAETVQPCRFAFVARKDFLKFVMQHGDACLYFAQYLSRDCHSAYDAIRSTRNPVPKRLARFLVAHCANGRISEGIVRATVALTHEAIAQRIGCSRETVCRTLSDLKRKRVAELVGTTLKVHDRATLESLAAS